MKPGTGGRGKEENVLGGGYGRKKGEDMGGKGKE